MNGAEENLATIDPRTMMISRPEEPRKEENTESEREKKLIADIKSKFEMAKAERLPWDTQWFVNAAFYFGQQWLVFNYSTLSLQEQPGKTHLPRLVVNRIRPAIQASLARLCRTKPTPVVLPSTTEESDIQAASLAEKALESIWQSDSGIDKMRQAILWALVSGNAFLTWGYDPRVGPVVATDETSGIKIRTGDVYFDPVPPGQIYPQPGKISLEECGWVIRSRIITKSAISFMFPIKGPLVKETTMGNTSFTLQTVPNSLRPGMRQEGVQVYSYYEKPSNEYPNGRRILCTDDLILSESTLDDFNGQFPLVHIRDVEQPGQFWATSVIQDAISLQKELNQSRSLIIHIKDLMSNPQIFYRAGSVDPLRFNNRAGNLVPYVGPVAPNIVPAPPIPSYLDRHLERLIRDLDEVLRVHDVSRGIAPTNLRSGRGIAYLQEADESAFIPIAQEIEEALEKTWAGQLRLMQKYYSESRTMRIVGANKSVLAFAFKNSDLRDNLDVRVIRGTLLGQSPVTRQENIMSYLAAGLIDKKQALTMLNLSEVRPIGEEEQLDIDEAQRALAALKRNEPVAPMSWQNNKVHIDIAKRYCKTADFSRQPDFIKQLIQKYIELHTIMMFKRANAIMSMTGAPTAQPQKGGLEATPVNEPGESGQELAEGLPPVPTPRKPFIPGKGPV